MLSFVIRPAIAHSSLSKADWQRHAHGVLRHRRVQTGPGPTEIMLPPLYILKQKCISVVCGPVSIIRKLQNKKTMGIQHYVIGKKKNKQNKRNREVGMKSDLSEEVCTPKPGFYIDKIGIEENNIV